MPTLEVAVKHTRPALIALAMAAPLVAILAATAPAVAAPPDPSFGGHVATCAQVMGFDGQHNPSHHHGPSGWDAAMTC